ncbi:MAG TPA: hypothetical protein VNK04_23970 [Gemmataceae bacterium]|jgi:hypothetical protein|nr:hypothetical protein [Gemmataceae bacterium]
MRVGRLGGAGGGFLVAVLAAAAGCGSGKPMGQVEGRVTFKGQPVTEGMISFSNAAGEGAEAPLGPEGKYLIRTPQGGLPVGDYVVTVTPGTYVDNSDPKTPPAVEEKRAPNIPPRYRRLGSTPLKATVQEGKNVFDFDLKP